MDPLLSTPSAAWNDVIAINMHSVFFCCKAVLPIMIMQAQGKGSIINISSVAGSKGGEDAHAYAVSKAGMNSITRSMAKTYFKDGVISNSVAPGWCVASAMPTTVCMLALTLPPLRLGWTRPWSNSTGTTPARRPTRRAPRSKSRRWLCFWPLMRPLGSMALSSRAMAVLLPDLATTPHWRLSRSEGGGGGVAEVWISKKLQFKHLHTHSDP